MNIPKLFSTEQRLKMLNNLIYKTDHLNVNKIARDTKLSKGLVSKYLNFLTKQGVLKKLHKKLLVQDNIKTKAIKLTLNLNIFDTNIFKKYKFVKSAGIYGSFVKGTNTEHSDIDLWLLIDKTSDENLAKMTSALKKTFKEVKPLYLTKEKVIFLKKQDPVFYYSLIFGSIIIYGEGIEAL